jgi:hypothetical protein
MGSRDWASIQTDPWLFGIKRTGPKLVIKADTDLTNLYATMRGQVHVLAAETIFTQTRQALTTARGDRCRLSPKHHGFSQ